MEGYMLLTGKRIHAGAPGRPNHEGSCKLWVAFTTAATPFWESKSKSSATRCPPCKSRAPFVKSVLGTSEDVEGECAKAKACVLHKAAGAAVSLMH